MLAATPLRSSCDSDKEEAVKKDEAAQSESEPEESEAADE